ncbi:MAG: GGDEF domain-containing protein [Comamonas sp.]|nr:GGDEF domain-containing protein [Comamonas sp.]
MHDAHSSIDHQAIETHIMAERMHQYMARQRILVAAGPIASAYQVFTKWQVADPQLLFAWWLTLLCVDAVTVIHTTLYLRQAAPPSPAAMASWRNRQIALQSLAGLIWGGSALLNYDLHTIDMPAALVLVTVSTVAVIALLPFRRAAFSWLLSVWVIPLFLLLSTGTPGHIHLALGICLLVGTQGLYFMNASHHLIDSLRKQFKADALSKALRESAERIHELATRDDLTGLYNRRQGMKLLGDWMGQPRQRAPGGMAERDSLGLLLLDVDFFKRVNDSHGHPAGDEVLREVARRLRSAVRDGDTVARVGGEEFMVLLPSVGADMALELAQRLRTCVAHQPVQLPDTALDVTISIGVAVTHSAEGIEAAIARADKALYAAKEGGRNRVVLAPQ